MTTLDPVGGTAEAWVAAANESLAMVATTALRLVAEPLAEAPTQGAHDLGAYVPLMTPGQPLQIGLIGDADSCEALARAMLQPAADEALSPSEVADALGELANMVAGAAKATMSTRIGLVALGLPMLMRGQLALGDRVACHQTRARIGPATVTLVVAQARPGRSTRPAPRL